MELRVLLSGDVETAAPDTRIADAAAQMHSADVGSLAIVDDGDVLGIFTERDVLRIVAEGVDPEGETVRSSMTAYPDEFPPDLDVVEAADWMLAAGYRHLPVVEEGVLVGMVSIKDILWAVTEDQGA